MINLLALLTHQTQSGSAERALPVPPGTHGLLKAQQTLGSNRDRGVQEGHLTPWKGQRASCKKRHLSQPRERALDEPQQSTFRKG